MHRKNLNGDEHHFLVRIMDYLTGITFAFCVVTDGIIAENCILNKLNNSIILYSARLVFEGAE